MIKIFFKWLTGFPSSKKSKVKNIFGKLLVGSMWIYILYSFTSGPGAVFASINPIGFKSTTIGKNIIHYPSDFVFSIDQISKTIINSRTVVDSKWIDGEFIENDKQPVIHYYLTKGVKDITKLTMVSTPAVTVFKNKIVLSTVFIDEMEWDLSSALKHEISHVNYNSRNGWMKSYINYPIWLDEGIASSFSDFPQHSRPYLNNLLKENPTLNSLTRLNNLFAWQSELFRDHDNFVKQYGYSLWITEDLINIYGMDKLKKYLNGDISFLQLAGKTLSDYETDWIKNRKQNKLIPDNVHLVYPSISMKVLSLWIVQTLIFLIFVSFLSLWTIRQIFKVIRIVPFSPMKISC